VLHKTLKEADITAIPEPQPGTRSRNGCAMVFERDQTKLGLPKPVDKVYAEAAMRHKKLLMERHGWLWRLVHLFGGR